MPYESTEEDKLMKPLMKKATVVLAGLLMVGAASADELRMAWYASTVHPYFDEVREPCVA